MTVERIFATLGTAAALFAATNLDDLVVLAVFNASAQAGGRPRRWEIWAGQYVGIALLFALSLAAARGLAVLPRNWLWLLGLLPFGLGVAKLVSAVRANGQEPPPAVTGLAGVIGVTVANGGDNLAGYIPFLQSVTATDLALTVAVFAAGIALWCLAGSWLVSRKRVQTILHRWGRWIVPAVYLFIGLYIFGKTGVPRWL
ncbi:cadmium transporter [Amycolatopsis rhizosphaerae]|uniref:Cadmium transporter n=1 Tax=Amycolatopsis rhizosphaerae TaxID=2053003 RepID=A0A558B154_9PSEU|nr:cadmium resistance transporter [Amycolatopsis rhizosphaerae]TVT30226.1 cadmium transporter [Amycolatopsis rhizosphaerae]